MLNNATAPSIHAPESSTHEMQNIIDPAKAKSVLDTVIHLAQYATDAIRAARDIKDIVKDAIHTANIEPCTSRDTIREAAKASVDTPITVLINAMASMNAAAAQVMNDVDTVVYVIGNAYKENAKATQDAIDAVVYAVQSAKDAYTVIDAMNFENLDALDTLDAIYDQVVINAKAIDLGIEIARNTIFTGENLDLTGNTENPVDITELLQYYASDVASQYFKKTLHVIGVNLSQTDPTALDEFIQDLAHAEQDNYLYAFITDYCQDQVETCTPPDGYCADHPEYC